MRQPKSKGNRSITSNYLKSNSVFEEKSSKTKKENKLNLV